MTVELTPAQARALLRATKTHAQVLRAGNKSASAVLGLAAKALEVALETQQ